MPGIIGLILAGGNRLVPTGWGAGARQHHTLLGSGGGGGGGGWGCCFLMFLGGLETSLDDLKRNANRASLFGLGDFRLAHDSLAPVAMLAPGSKSSGLPCLIASCFASHTLVAQPLAERNWDLAYPPSPPPWGPPLIV